MKKVIFVWVPKKKRNLTETKSSISEALSDYLSQLLLMGFTLTGNRERQKEESRTHSSRVDICKWLLRNE